MTATKGETMVELNREFVPFKASEQKKKGGAV